MNENVQKSLIMGASIMVTIGVISIGLMIFSQGSSLVKESSKNMITLAEELSSKKYIAYENATVSGAEVINAINSYAGRGVKVVVKTKSNTDGKVYSGKYSNNNSDSDDYINAGGMFASSIETNSNGCASQIRFEQI